MPNLSVKILHDGAMTMESLTDELTTFFRSWMLPYVNRYSITNPYYLI